MAHNFTQNFMVTLSLTDFVMDWILHYEDNYKKYKQGGFRKKTYNLLVGIITKHDPSFIIDIIINT